MNKRWLVSCAAAALCLGAAAASAATSPGAWIDKKPVAAWNKAGAAIPRPVKADAGNEASCKSNIRKASSPEDQRVAAAGWQLIGAHQQFGSTTVVEGASGFDGQCRWAGYQAFVFVGGTFAGTLAPAAMDSRSDGALDTVRLGSATSFSADFTRYADSDPLCCPSRTSYVSYALKKQGGHAIVTVTDVSTAANPK